MSANSIWDRLDNQFKLRMYQDPAQLDARLTYTGETTDAVQTELYLQKAQTAADVISDNGVPYYTENGILTVEPGTLVLVKGTTLGLRTDTLAAHHVSEFAFAVLRPLTGDMVVVGEYGTTNYTAATPAIAGANPANMLVFGTAGHSAFTVNTDGTIQHLVTGAAGQTIAWHTVADYVRAISIAPPV